MQSSLRTVAITCLLLLVCLLLTYAGSYYWLSRRGMREAAALGVDGLIAYVPMAEMSSGKNSAHDVLSFIYYPANAIDRRLFHGWSPFIHETLSG